MKTQSTATSSKSMNTANAEMRKTFIFYASWYRALSHIPADMQLAAYNAIFRYALYGEEVSDSEDCAVRVAFELIRENIDMAQAEYDAKSQTRRRAAQKRWAKAKEDSPEEDDPQESQESQPQTTKESTTSTTTMPEPQAFEPQASGTKDEAPSQQITPQEFVADFLSETRSTQLDDLAKELGVTRHDVESMTRAVVAEWSLTDTNHNTHAEAARHLVNTLRKKISHRRKEMTTASTPGGRPNWSDTQPKLGVGEYFNERGERTYSSSRVVVPLNAPPRPSKFHWWHETGEYWTDNPF